MAHPSGKDEEFPAGRELMQRGSAALLTSRAPCDDEVPQLPGVRYEVASDSTQAQLRKVGGMQARRQRSGRSRFTTPHLDLCTEPRVTLLRERI